MTKYGSNRMTSSPGFTDRAEAQQESARGAGGDDHLAVGLAVLGVHLLPGAVAERGQAHREGVGVLTASDRLRSPRS